MHTVSEISRLTGVSIRTLHHYDAIGLLTPANITNAGYRLYDDNSLRRLQIILLLRELEFPLEEIRHILDSPGCDRQSLLDQQILLLKQKKKRLDNLISFACQLKHTEENYMDFSAFNQTEDYAAQAKAAWGKTDAYKEFEKKTAGQTPQQMSKDGSDLMGIFAQFGAIRHHSPESDEAQALAARLQQFITDHYYTCTPRILRSLGTMYAAGGSMTDNIDAAGGAGTAAFAAEAIAFYCSKAE